jgi:thiamine transporter ThiT
MMNSEAIHRSVADADDLEEIKDQEITVGDVFQSLVQHPLQVLTRWNWKAAILGAILRASFYLTIYKVSKESWIVTLSAVLVEFIFRFLTSGISGALVQSFRKASPAWLATLIVSISLPFFGHTVEYITHYAQENMFPAIFAASENSARQKAFAISVLFSVVSALFNLWMMRHGVLLVGAGGESKPFLSDLKRIPRLVVEFMVFLPNAMLNFVRDGRILTALAIFASFGFTVGGILGVFRGKWSWAWTTALGAWAILFAFTLLVITISATFKIGAFQRQPNE